MKKIHKSESEDLGIDIDLSAPFKHSLGLNESEQTLLDLSVTTDHINSMTSVIYVVVIFIGIIAIAGLALLLYYL